jgi:exodeoxyribonuclease V beta subunit
MQRFDCLSLDCPLFGPHLLEASAGTGKTFSIEHIYVRLILESIEVEQILAVTFTRAATRELKGRIRANIEKALEFIQMGKPAWDYLQPHLGSKEAIRLLADALSGFDRCQIFTIHGFCYRMLKEFAFEANVGTISNPEEGPKIPKNLQDAVYDFLENGVDGLCPEQISLLLKQFDSIDEVADRLLRMEEVELSESFSELFSKCKAALHPWELIGSKLLDDFHAVKKNYKAAVKGDFEIQLNALANLDLFPALLKQKGTLFDFLSEENRKVKAKEPPFLNYPGFFDWARIHIAPLVKRKVFPVLQMEWNRVAEKILAQEEYFDPDDVLLRMRTAIAGAEFADHVRKKYAAAIIDEFQDTDAVQWDIFQKLFFEEPLRALYLVGDPKQSIYRFRKADIYTYLKARDFLGERNLYQLDTNFRSSKSLIGALNALFEREWLQLPKINRALPYHRVKAGAQIEANFPDEKGAIHFFLAEGEPAPLFDEAFLPYAVHEIEKLKLKQVALLVKDRFQAERALDFLKKRGIPAIAKSHTPLGQTNAFRSIEELFTAILSPHDKNAAHIVMAGPFAKPDLSFQESKILLEEKGLVPFAKELVLDSDAMQIFELLFAWERKEGFSFEGLNRFLKQLKHLSAEDGGRRRMEVDEEAVQIMTLHISKGLEFDVVFALGLASRTPQSEEVEELDAEKKRQLYVAMTRAKKRLYVPIADSATEAEPGSHSPMELFSRHFEGSFTDQVTLLSKNESITLERVQLPMSLAPPVILSQPPVLPSPPLPRSFTPSFLSSFTTLAQTKESEVKWSEPDPTQFTLQTMPRGSETGIAIHTIFERLFSSKKPLWRDPAAIRALVEENLLFSPLAPWKEAIQQMVLQTVAMPLQSDGEFFTLSEIEKFQVEMEFVFSSTPNFVKGFIDLIFYHRKKVYFIDWKTNWLEEYGPASLQKAMQTHDYGLQAALYTEAIQKHFKAEFGGAYYLFLRGGTSTYRILH